MTTQPPPPPSLDERQKTAIVMAKVHETDAVVIRDLALTWPAIVTEADALNASEQLRDLATLYKAMEEEKKKITAPLWQAWKATNDMFAPALKCVDEARKFIGKIVADYHLAADKAREAAMHKMLEGQAATAPIHVHAEGVSVIDKTTWELVDATLVPREFCSPDASKITAAVNAGQEVPGVKVSAGKQLRVRRHG